MKEYLDLAKFVLENGNLIGNRTGIDTISYFGKQIVFDISKGFPLLTTKKMAVKSIIHELLWFISGSTNIKYLVDNNVNIWNEWPFEKYKESNEYKNETISEFISKIKQDSNFASKWGELGPVYGKQWRNFDGVDQLKKLVESIKNDPFSRRLIISSWNPKELENMVLPPCHCFFQFYVSNDKKLSCQLYQRSADVFLGVPFNIASYALLLCLIAHVTDLVPDKFVYTLGNVHIYVNHINQIKQQLTRQPYHLPKLVLNKNVKNLFDFKIDDIKFENYTYHPAIKGEVAV